MKSMQHNIMRRVYISYALSYLEQPLLYVGLVLGGAIALFGRFTHVASLLDTTLATPLGHVPTYIVDSFIGAIARGELGTVLVTLTVASLTAVALSKLSRLHVLPKLQVA